MGATNAEGVALLEGAALTNLAELAAIIDEDIGRLNELVAERGVAQVGAGHTVVHPTAGLRLALGDVPVDVLSHVGEEGDDVVVGDGLDGVDLLLVEGSVLADVGGLILGDADLAHLGVSLAGEHLDFLPDGVLVLEREDVAHLRAGIAINHASSFDWAAGRLCRSDTLQPDTPIVRVRAAGRRAGRLSSNDGHDFARNGHSRALEIKKLSVLHGYIAMHRVARIIRATKPQFNKRTVVRSTRHAAI